MIIKLIYLKKINYKLDIIIKRTTNLFFLEHFRFTLPKGKIRMINDETVLQQLIRKGNQGKKREMLIFTSINAFQNYSLIK